jgi:hypothetical protein
LLPSKAESYANILINAGAIENVRGKHSQGETSKLVFLQKDGQQSFVYGTI